MKLFFLLPIACLSLFSCTKKSTAENDNTVIISQNVKWQENENNLRLTSGKFQYNFNKQKLPLNKVIVLNASLVGYITELNLENKIMGVASPEYIFSPKISELVQQKKIINIGNEQKYDIEKILALKPDAIFTNYIPSFENTYDLLTKNGIKVIFLDEYMEQTPLEKSAYIKVFGKLMGSEAKSDSILAEIEHNYKDLKKIASQSKNKPTIICNEMYGNQWFVPGGKSFASRYFIDAHSDYPWISNSSTGSVPVSFEEVFVKSTNAKYWVNVGNYKKKSELLAFNPIYSKLSPYKNGKVYSIGGKINGKANDYFESGTVRADKVLQDYINIFHPQLLRDTALVYMKKLK